MTEERHPHKNDCRSIHMGVEVSGYVSGWLSVLHVLGQTHP